MDDLLAGEVGYDGSNEFIKKFVGKQALGKFFSNYIDNARPVKRLHDKFLKTIGIERGHPLYDQLNVWRKWHAYYGKGQYEVVEQFNSKYYNPLMDAMREYGVDQETLGRYLIARRAPSMNTHYKNVQQQFIEEYVEKYKDRDKPKDYKEQLQALRDATPSSGLTTEQATAIVREMENDPDYRHFQDFLLSDHKPLHLIYEMNKNSLEHLDRSEMIRPSEAGGAAEKVRLIQASSYHNWRSGAKFEYQSIVNLPDNKYSYVPMQGFEGETQELYDRDQAFQALGKPGTTSGKGFNQPKTASILVPALKGRDPERVKGPNPEQVLATSFEQWQSTVIRSYKNEVSQSFGELFEFMRAVAYHDKKIDGDLDGNTYGMVFEQSADPELQQLYQALIKQKDTVAEVKKEFDQTFRLEHEDKEILKDYSYDIIQGTEETEGGEGQKDVPRLQVIQKTLNKMFKPDDYSFVYRKAGEPQFIQLNKDSSSTTAERVASSINNLAHQPLDGVAAVLNPSTKFLARMYTSANPAFVIPNFIRDYLTAQIHLRTEDKKDIANKALNWSNIQGLFTGVRQAESLILQGKDPLEGGDVAINKATASALLRDFKGKDKAARRKAAIAMYQFFKKAGGKVGYFRHDSIWDSMQKIKKELKRGRRTGRRLRAVSRTWSTCTIPHLKTPCG